MYFKKYFFFTKITIINPLFNYFMLFCMFFFCCWWNEFFWWYLFCMF